MSEIEWRDIPGYDGVYQASNTGQIKSDALTKGRILKSAATHGGYRTVVVRGKCCTVHSLIMLTFVGKRPEGMQINHKNGDKTDNRPSNLEYCTPRENIHHHMAAHGSAVAGELHQLAKLTDEKVRQIRLEARDGLSRRELAIRYGVTKATITFAVNRITWKHVTDEPSTEDKPA